MSLTNNSLTYLISAGADALSDLYDVSYIFKNSELSESQTASLKVRAGDFKIPPVKRNIINIDYQNIQVPIVTNYIELNRTAELSFRLDSNLEIYKLFASRIKNDNTYRAFLEEGNTDCLDTIVVKYSPPKTLGLSGFYADDRGNLRGLLEFPDQKGLWDDRESYLENLYTWTFKNVIPTQISIDSFSRNSGQQMKVNVSFNYGYIQEDIDAENTSQEQLDPALMAEG